MQPDKALRTKTLNGAPPRNSMAGRAQAADKDVEPGLQELLHALQSMRGGDFSVRITGEHAGLIGKIADTFNDIVTANERMAQQLERAGQIVGREGRTRHRVKFSLSSGAWSEMEDWSIH